MDCYVLNVFSLHVRTLVQDNVSKTNLKISIKEYLESETLMFILNGNLANFLAAASMGMNSNSEWIETLEPLIILNS